MTTNESLTRLTVNLISKAAEALTSAAALSRDSRTDCVNRAIQLYDFVLQQRADGRDLWLGNVDGTEFTKILLL